MRMKGFLKNKDAKKNKRGGMLNSFIFIFCNLIIQLQTHFEECLMISESIFDIMK